MVDGCRVTIRDEVDQRVCRVIVDWNGHRAMVFLSHEMAVNGGPVAWLFCQRDIETYFNLTGREKDEFAAMFQSAVRAYEDPLSIRDQLLGFPGVNDPYLWGPPKLKQCANCHATNLDQFFTSQRDGRVLCQSCFDQRADKGLAKEEGQPVRKPKKPHPLDVIQGLAPEG